MAAWSNTQHTAHIQGWLCLQLGQQTCAHSPCPPGVGFLQSDALTQPTATVCAHISGLATDQATWTPLQGRQLGPAMHLCMQHTWQSQLLFGPLTSPAYTTTDPPTNPPGAYPSAHGRCGRVCSSRRRLSACPADDQTQHSTAQRSTAQHGTARCVSCSSGRLSQLLVNCAGLHAPSMLAAVGAACKRRSLCTASTAAVAAASAA